MGKPFGNAMRDGARRTPADRGVSGVHEAPTEPAPYLDDDERITKECSLVGSLPVAAIGIRYEPIVRAETAETVGFEARATCDAPGLQGPEDLFARALFEHRIGELCRVLRDKAFEGAEGRALFVDVHSQELKEGLLIRPDDPIALSESLVYLQLSQSAFSTVCMHVLSELRDRCDVSLVIDGVGAGPSSLVQVVDLQPRLVKLSAELTVGVETDERRRAAVRHLAELCGSLGCAVGARDVSTRDEVRALVDCGVGYLQGPAIGAATDRPERGVLPG